ncbi:hypothetical protein MJD09_06710 [bacterium]|nr:hypothetical protein [bacterium]
MKRFWPIFWIMALTIGALLSACSNEQLTNSAEENLDEEEQISLEKEFGGYSSSNESPGFADTEILDNDKEDAIIADAISLDARVLSDLSADSIRVYYLRVTWGLLEGDSLATDVIDWSGSAEVSKGTLVLLRTIRFEGNDAIVLPRESRQKIDFMSFTKPHFDGLALAIIDNDTTENDMEGTLTINAGSYSNTLSFSALDSLELIEPVGDLGHEVSIVSRSKDIVPFAGGFLAGRWVKTRPNGGVFKGRWINSTGTNSGHLRGIWGVRRDGQKVFKGKYISLDGEFRGLLAGHWEYNRDDNVGHFRGRWANRNRQTVGTVAGRFKTGREDSGRGFFQGRYKVTKKANSENPDERAGQ